MVAQDPSQPAHKKSLYRRSRKRVRHKNPPLPAGICRPQSSLTRERANPCHRPSFSRCPNRLRRPWPTTALTSRWMTCGLGPRIIQFGLVPGWVKLYRNSKSAKSGANEPSPEDASRVKVQDIVARQTDLALALKTPYLRIEAPVPGEALVGLEVPNPCPRSVVLRSVVESEPFQKIAAKKRAARGPG